MHGTYLNLTPSKQLARQNTNGIVHAQVNMGDTHLIAFFYASGADGSTTTGRN